jgi:hypothetical protein
LYHTGTYRISNLRICVSRWNLTWVKICFEEPGIEQLGIWRTSFRTSGIGHSGIWRSKLRNSSEVPSKGNWKTIAETRTKTFHWIFKLARPRASKLGVLLKTWTTLADHKEKTREKYSHGFSRPPMADCACLSTHKSQIQLSWIDLWENQSGENFGAWAFLTTFLQKTDEHMRSLKLVSHSTINQLHYQYTDPLSDSTIYPTLHHISTDSSSTTLVSKHYVSYVKWTTYCYSLAAITYHYRVLPADLISHTQKLVLKVKAFHASPLLYTQF